MRATRRIRLGVILACAGVAMVFPGAAQAAIPSVFGGDVACAVQADGARFCGSSSPRSTTRTFDGVPLDVNVAFPPAPAAGPDGGYPLVMIFHGYGGGKFGLATMQRWLDRGYAAFSMTDRGFRESCGSSASRSADPGGCAAGYIRLIDNRYEVRDAQFLAGRLVDEGLVDPKRLGAIGGSYGGGMSLALAALKNRIVMPDGSLVPWTSPNGTPMKLAAAAPFITWSDLAYSLVPNGGTLDYVAEAPYEGRFGVMKESLVNGLYVSGQAAPGYYAAPGTDPSADITTWRDRLLAGEPYDGDPAAQAILDEIISHHSAYYIDPAKKPAPILWSQGFTDDLFPADEALRFYNRTRAESPKTHISLVFGEVSGHPRSASKQNVNDLIRSREVVWFEHFVKGTGPKPFEGVTAFTQTCPTTEPGGGPFKARNWARIAPGEIRLAAKGKRTIAAASGEPSVAAPFDPVTGGGSCAQQTATEEPGTATYDLDPAPAGGFTLLGSPTVIARFGFAGDTSQVAARLLDVDPAGQEMLVARGLWRPEDIAPRQVFQLHANGWHFDEGHVARLELLAKDDGNGPLGGYGRPSNDQQDVTVKNLKLRLPVAEKPGSLKGLVKAHEQRFLPKGYELAPGFRNIPLPELADDGPLGSDARTVSVEVACPKQNATCRHGQIALKARERRSKFPVGFLPGRFLAAYGSFDLKGGASETVQMGLTRKARRHLRAHHQLHVIAYVSSAESPSLARRQSRLIITG